MTYYDLNMNSKLITNVQDPSGNQDVATKKYVDTSSLTPLFYPNLLSAGLTSGIIASNYDAGYITSTVSFTVNRNPFLYSVFLKAGTVVTNGLLMTGNLTTASCSRACALYNKNGVMLSVWNGYTSSPVPQSRAVLVTPIGQGPVTILTDDFYYVCFVFGFSSSMTLQVPLIGNGGNTAALFYNYPITSTTGVAITSGGGVLGLFRSISISPILTTASTALPSDFSNGWFASPTGYMFWFGIN